MACTYVFRSLFRYFLVLITRLSGSAQILYGRGLSGILLLSFVRISFRATFRVNGTRFGRYDSGAANEGVVSNGGRSLISRLLRNGRDVTRMFNVLRTKGFIACLTRNLDGNKATRFRIIRARICVVGNDLFVIGRRQECSFLSIKGFSANEGGCHTQEGGFTTIKMFLYRKGEIFADQCVSLRKATRIARYLCYHMRANVFAFLQATEPRPINEGKGTIRAFNGQYPGRINRYFTSKGGKTNYQINGYHLKDVTRENYSALFTTVIWDCRAAVTRERLRFALTLLTNGLTYCEAIRLIYWPIFADRDFRLRRVNRMFI